MEAQARTRHRTHAREVRMRSWLGAIYNFLCEMFFGCSHGHLTRPFTIQSHCYKVCLDCGGQFPYSLEKMRLLHPWEIMVQPQLELAPILMESELITQQDYRHSKAVA